MRVPNFLIVGAPKCGTTSMHDYLNQHVCIFMPTIKEPHFFGSDLTPSEFTGNKELYMKLFRKREEKLIGEASTWYLYSKNAAKEISEFNKDMKIVIMIRNPISAAESLHSQALFTMNEDVEDYEEAFSLEQERMKGHNLPKNISRLESVFYTETFKYYEQIKRYYDCFGKDNVHIILFDDFIKDTHFSVAQTLEFLGVSDEFKPDIGVKNKKKKVRSKLVQSILQFRNKKGLKFIPIQYRRRVKEYLRDLNTTSKKSVGLSEDIKMYLFKEFEGDILKTEKLINRNLDDWKIG